MKRHDDQGERIAVGAAEAARLIGVSERHLWSLTKRGLIPHVRLGSRVLYVVEQLRELLSAGAVAGG